MYFVAVKMDASKGNVSAGRCVGVCKASSVRRELLVTIGVSESSLTPPDADTPMRRPPTRFSRLYEVFKG
jgi:hypothetical protein